MAVSKTDPKPRISVFGLGKLGATIAGCHANRGYPVTGFDVRGDAVEACKRGVPPVMETGIEELYTAAGPWLTGTSNPEKAVRESDVTMIVVPTPSLAAGDYSLSYVLETCEVIGKALASKPDYHLVVLKSTVMPGASDGEIVPALERASGKRAGVDFGYCYNPEFIALGSIIRNIYQPDLVLIGESDPRAGEILERIYADLVEGKEAPISRMSPVNAELAKLSVNSYVTMKITFANLLAEICEHLPGGNAHDISKAIGMDSRIGRKYLSGGLGFGGPCFPRDNKAVLHLAKSLGMEFPLAQTTDDVNDRITLRVADRLEEKLAPGSQVAVLGLSYKPHTPVIEESQGLLLAGDLARRGFRVRAFDPQALENARGVLGDRIEYAKSLEDCIAGAEAIVVSTDWPEFSRVHENARSLGAPLIVDCWGALEKTEGYEGEILRLGVYAAS